MNYDPSYFVEREQYITKMREAIDEDFDGEMGEVFHEVMNTYEFLIDLVREWESCPDKQRRLEIDKEYERVAKLFKRYLVVMQETMDGGIDKLEEAYKGGKDAE